MQTIPSPSPAQDFNPNKPEEEMTPDELEQQIALEEASWLISARVNSMQFSFFCSCDISLPNMGLIFKATVVWKSALQTPARPNISDAERLIEFNEDLRQAIQACTWWIFFRLVSRSNNNIWQIAHT